MRSNSQVASDIFLIGTGGAPIFPDMFSSLHDSYGSSVGSTLTVGWLMILRLFFLFFPSVRRAGGVICQLGVSLRNGHVSGALTSHRSFCVLGHFACEPSAAAGQNWATHSASQVLQPPNICHPGCQKGSVWPFQVDWLTLSPERMSESACCEGKRGQHAKQW